MLDKVFSITGNKISTLITDEHSLKFSSSTSTTVENFKEAFAKKLSLATKVEIKYDAIKSIKKAIADKSTEYYYLQPGFTLNHSVFVIDPSDGEVLFNGFSIKGMSLTKDDVRDLVDAINNN